MLSTRATAGRVIAAGVAAVALAAIIGAVAFGAGRATVSSPTPMATPQPTAAPTSPVTPAPVTPAPVTPAPTPEAVGVPPVVVLDTIQDPDPQVAIDDKTGTLVSIRSGHAGDGMSVRWNSAQVVQLGPNTVEVTWVGFPGEELIGLTIDANDDDVPVLIFDQKAPYANTDALGSDRVLVLTFDKPVDADKIDVGFPSLEASF
jgi:hypothetical protein